jgi:hypothetical protein
MSEQTTPYSTQNTANMGVKRTAQALRSRFANHTPTVRRILARMTDEELVEVYNAHCREHRPPAGYLPETTRQLHAFRDQVF